MNFMKKRRMFLNDFIEIHWFFALFPIEPGQIWQSARCLFYCWLYQTSFWLSKICNGCKKNFTLSNSPQKIKAGIRMAAHSCKFVVLYPHAAKGACFPEWKISALYCRFLVFTHVGKRNTSRWRLLKFFQMAGHHIRCLMGLAGRFFNLQVKIPETFQEKYPVLSADKTSSAYYIPFIPSAF